MIRTRIILAIIIFAIAVVFVTPVFVGPIIDKKITALLNEKYPDLSIEIDKVRWSLIPSRLTIKKITISSKAEYAGQSVLNGKIATIQLKGIKLLKFLFKNEYKVEEVIISNSNLEGIVPLKDQEKTPTLSSFDLSIGNVLFDQINLALKDSSSALTLSVKNGVLNIVDLKIEKLDTLLRLNHLNFRAEQIQSVSDDSLYTYTATGIVYSDTLKRLSNDSLSIIPNYDEYDFTARHQYETDWIETHFSHITLDQFSAADFYNSGNLVSSYITIGKVDMNVFRDKRKEDSPKEKPAFQEMIYNYPGFLRIDSITFADGQITYTEHAEKATEPGKISIQGLNAKIYNLTDDTIYKTQDASLIMIAQALIMGKGKLEVSLNAKLFDPLHAFSMKGMLAELELKELNPILEPNAFMFANSGKIEKINFNFTANDNKATGKMTLLYNELDISIVNKRTNDTSGLKTQIISFFANKGTWDSNPVPGEEVRVGIIDFERDPTRFFINYSIKSIISGIKSSIKKIPKKKKTFLQRIFSSGDEKQEDASKN